MEDSKRRAYIKQQATTTKKKKKRGRVPVNPSSKRKLSEKTSCLPKKPKVTPDLVVGLKAEPKKTTTQLGQGRGKGLMMGHVPVTEKPLVLLREDSRYVLEKLSSIIKINDYEDLATTQPKLWGRQVFLALHK